MTEFICPKCGEALIQCEDEIIRLCAEVIEEEWRSLKAQTIMGNMDFEAWFETVLREEE